MKEPVLKVLILMSLVAFGFTALQMQAQDEITGPVIEKVEKMLELIAVYDYDRSRDWQQGFQDLMKQVYGHPEIRLVTEQMMAEFLRSDASRAGKQIICRELGMIGSELSVPVLSDMLRDPDMGGTALLALGKIPGKSADEALRDALQYTGKQTKIAVIHSIADRKDEQAIGHLRGFVHDPDHEIAGAAIAALGGMGSPEGAVILEALFLQSDGELKWKAADSWLNCADHFLQHDDAKMAGRIYKQVYDAAPPPSLKHAALQGQFLTSGEDPFHFIAGYLQSEDPSFHRQVIGLVYLIAEPVHLGRLFSEIPDLPESSRLFLFNTLANVGDFSVRDEILEAINSEDRTMRMAAIKALPGVGWPSDALLLASMAAGKQGSERDIVRQSLNMLRAEGTNDSIMNAIGSSEGEIRAELIRSTGERNMKEAVGMLIRTASSPDLSVCTESIRALGILASPEFITDMMDILGNAPSSRVRLEAERAILSLIQKLPAGSDRSREIVKRLSSVADPASVISLINILGKIGDQKDLPVMRKYLASQDIDIQLAVIKAFTDWPDASPLPDLKEIARSTDDQRKHALALKGWIEVMTSDSQMDPHEKLKEIETAWGHATNTVEKRMVISGLNRVHSLEALDMALDLMDEAEIRREAEAAAIVIAEQTSHGSPEETRKRLFILLSITDNEDHKARANKILERIEK